MLVPVETASPKHEVGARTLRRNPAFAGNGNGRSGPAEGDGIGRSTARLGGLEQALGEKPFVDDLHVPGMLHGAMVLTEHPRARVRKIDTGAAASMPGSGVRL